MPNSIFYCGDKKKVIHDSELLSWDLTRIPAEYKTENIFSVPVRSMVVTVRGQEHWMTHSQWYSFCYFQCFCEGYCTFIADSSTLYKADTNCTFLEQISAVWHCSHYAHATQHKIRLVNLNAFSIAKKPRYFHDTLSELWRVLNPLLHTSIGQKTTDRISWKWRKDNQ